MVSLNNYHTVTVFLKGGLVVECQPLEACVVVLETRPPGKMLLADDYEEVLRKLKAQGYDLRVPA